MSTHICPKCYAYMVQIGERNQWRYMCPECASRWQIGPDGVIRSEGKKEDNECRHADARTSRPGS